MEEFGKLSSVDTTLLSKAKNSVTSVRSALFFFFFFFLSLWNPFHFIFSIDLKKKKVGRIDESKQEEQRSHRIRSELAGFFSEFS